MYGRSDNTSLDELFDKEVNAQKSLKKILQGSSKLPQAHKKVCDENERKKKPRAPKIFLEEGRSL